MFSIQDLKPDPNQIREFLSAITVPGSPFEIRILNTRRGGPSRFYGGTQGGFFDDVDDAVSAIRRITGGDAPGVYVTINELDPVVKNWGLGRIAKSKRSTSDGDVRRLRHLYIDLDPVRPPDTNATDAEHEAALARSREVVTFLKEHHGWPPPVWTGSSGSGAQLLYRIDLSVEEKSEISRVLQVLDQLFSDDHVKIDTSVGNPARITRIAGTVNAKSVSPQPDRQWRLATGSSDPDAGVVTSEMLRALGGVNSTPGPNVSGKSESHEWGGPGHDIPELLDRNGIHYRNKDRGYATAYELDQCLTSSDHSDGAAILQFPSGAVAYVCQHNRCRDKCWQDIKPVLGLPQWNPASPQAISYSDTSSSEDEWDDPIPLDPMYGPSLPLDAFPPQLRDVIVALAEEMQTPPDLPAVVALATISAACGGLYVVSIPEWGWEEPVHGQFIAVAEPASRKSGVFRFLTKPIVEYEQEVLLEDKNAVAEWESKYRVLENDLKAAENKVGKPDKDGKITVTEAQRMEAVLALQLHHAKRPTIRRFMTDDATPEAVKSLLAEQGGSLAVMSAESAFLSNVAGRYSNAPNLDVLLNGHAGDSITVDRKGKAREIVDRACLTLGLMVQPQVITDLGSIHGFRTRGGAARLLVSIPRDFLGIRRIDVERTPQRVLDDWGTRIRGILSRRQRGSVETFTPKEISLSQQAHVVFRQFREWHEPLLGKGSAHEDIKDWSGKLEGALLRLAGLIHVYTHEVPEANRISAETIRQAIDLARYFTEHARVMYRLMGGEHGSGEAADVLQVIETLGTAVSRRGLHQALRGRAAFRSATDLDRPLKLLEDHGFIKQVQLRKEQGGRPAAIIHLNPRHKMLKTLKTPPALHRHAGFECFEDGFVTSAFGTHPRAIDLPPTGTDGPEPYLEVL